MKRQHRRTIEILAFFVAYSAVYLVVLGPAIGAVLPGFDRPAFSQPGFRPSGDLPDTGRGWLFMALGLPALLGYMYLRARVAGVSLGEFWNPPGEQLERRP